MAHGRKGEGNLDIIYAQVGNSAKWREESEISFHFGNELYVDFQDKDRDESKLEELYGRISSKLSLSTSEKR